jgi:hypothetical protein
MKDPKRVLTKGGYQEYSAKAYLLQSCLFYFINNSDDLHLDDHEELSDALYNLNEIVENGFLLDERNWADDKPDCNRCNDKGFIRNDEGEAFPCDRCGEGP